MIVVHPLQLKYSILYRLAELILKRLLFIPPVSPLLSALLSPLCRLLHSSGIKSMLPMLTMLCIFVALAVREFKDFTRLQRLKNACRSLTKIRKWKLRAVNWLPKDGRETQECSYSLCFWITIKQYMQADAYQSFSYQCSCNFKAE